MHFPVSFPRRDTLLLCLCLYLRLLPASGQVVSPPMLVYPANGDSLVLSFPTFSWTPAYPIASNTRSAYAVRIVEVLGDQSPEGAIQANPDWYAQTGLTNTLLPYPLFAPPFVKGKKYAWQVELDYTYFKEEAQRQSKMLSEVYWFGMADAVRDSVCALKLTEEKTDKYYIITDYTLRFNLEPPGGEPAENLTYQLTDSEGKPLSQTVPKPVKAQGHYYVALGNWPELRKKAARNRFYTLQALSPSGKQYTLRFTLN
jgi:hypothetical protein